MDDREVALRKRLIEHIEILTGKLESEITTVDLVKLLNTLHRESHVYGHYLYWEYVNRDW